MREILAERLGVTVTTDKHDLKGFASLLHLVVDLREARRKLPAYMHARRVSYMHARRVSSFQSEGRERVRALSARSFDLGRRNVLGDVVL